MTPEERERFRSRSANAGTSIPTAWKPPICDEKPPRRSSRRPWPFLLTVVPDTCFLRLLDGDHHRRNDSDARKDVRAQLFLEVRRFAFAPSLELEAPDAQRVRTEDELRAHLLEALDAESRHGPG